MKSFLYEEEMQEILLLLYDLKHNPNHDHLGRFSTEGEAHLIVARDGTRTFGPKHPSNVSTRVSGKALSDQDILSHPDIQQFLSGDTPYGATNKNGDVLLHTLYKMQGFDGLPQVVDDLAPYIAQGEVDGLRGINGGGGQHERDFMNGDYFAGQGIFGNGTYMATDHSVGLGHVANPKEREDTIEEASMYIDTRREFLHIAIKTGSKYGDYKTLLNQAAQESKIHEKNINLASHNLGKYKPESSQYAHLLETINKEALLLSISKDVGMYATAKGYDGYHVPESAMGGMNAYPSTHTVMLNRTALRVKKTLVPYT